MGVSRGVHVMELDYAATLDDRLIHRLEEAARGIGLPLRELELIGQDRSLARSFVESVKAGEHERFLDRVDWSSLRRRLHEQADGSLATRPSDPEPATA